MNEDDQTIRQALHATALPAAPVTLLARRDEIGRRPVSVQHRWRWPWVLLVPVAAALLIALATSMVGVGRLVPQPTPSSSATSARPGELTHFDEGGLAFDYPASWRVFHYQEVSSFTNLVAYLATVDVPEPCITTGNSTACEARYVLTPDSLVVAVSSNGMPGFSVLNVPSGATALVVDRLPAYFAHEPSTVVGATETLTWTLARPASVDNNYTIRATIRGPNVAQFETALQTLVASLHFDPPVVPLPSGPGAAERAATTALGVLAKDSSVWACFPAPGGSRQMEVSSLTNGPTLARPQLATCATAIEATPLQLWRMTLTLRLPKADPQVGHGELITLWVNPDGTPGQTTSSSLP